MSTYLTTGFVLRQRPWREQDRLYTIYTERFGKVELVAAGSRKITSKLAGHLLPFARLEIMLARGRTFDRLAAAALRQLYLRPPYHLLTAILASTFLEIVDNLTQTNQPEPKLFALLPRALGGLTVAGPDKKEAWRHLARFKLMQFIMEMLNITGLTMRLHKCDVCGRPLTSEVNFSWSRHGFLHKLCLSPAEVAIELNDEIVKWFNYQSADGINTAVNLPPAALAFLTDYLVGQSGRKLETLNVLRSVL